MDYFEISAVYDMLTMYIMDFLNRLGKSGTKLFIFGNLGWKFTLNFIGNKNNIVIAKI